jgi:hypothetical protein
MVVKWKSFDYQQRVMLHVTLLVATKSDYGFGAVSCVMK